MLVNRRKMYRYMFVCGVEIISYDRAEQLVSNICATTCRKARRILSAIKRGTLLPVMIYHAALTVDSFGNWVIVDNWND